MNQADKKQPSHRKISVVSSNKSLTKYFEPAEEVKSQSDRRQSHISGLKNKIKVLPKRPNSIGHQSSRSRESEPQVDQPKASIKSSRSISSLQKKRISWGKSKVLEFYANDYARLGSNECSESQQDEPPASSQQKGDKNQAESLQINIFKQNSRPNTKPQQDAVKKRYSHMKVHKEYELALVDASMEDDLRQEVTPQKEAKGQEVEEEKLDKHIKFQLKPNLKERPQSPTEENRVDQDEKMDDQQDNSKMNDEPTPRKSDVYDSSRDSIQHSRRRSSNQAPVNMATVVGRTFDLRRSMDQSQKEQMDNNVPKDEELKEKKQLSVIEEDMDISKEGSSLEVNQDDKNKSTNNAMGVSMFTTFTMEPTVSENVGGKRLSTNSHHQNFQSLQMPDSLNQPLNNLESSLNSEVQNIQRSEEAQPYKQETQNQNQQQQPHSPQTANTQQQQHQMAQQPARQTSPVKQQQLAQPLRHSIADQRRPHQDNLQLSYTQPQYKAPNKLELLQKLTGIERDQIQNIYNTNDQAQVALLDMTFQTTTVLNQLVIPTAQAIVNYHKNLLIMQKKMRHLQEVKQRVWQVKNEFQNFQLNKQKELQNILRHKQQALLINGNTIDWQSLTQSQVNMALHKTILLQMNGLKQPVKQIKMKLIPDIQLKLDSQFLELTQRILQAQSLKLKTQSGLLLDINNFDSDDFVLVKAKASTIAKHAELVTSGIDNLIGLLGKCKIIKERKPASARELTEMVILECLHTKDQKGVLFDVEVDLKQGVHATLIDSTIRPFNLFANSSYPPEQTQRIKDKFQQQQSRMKPNIESLVSQVNFLASLL